MESKSDEKNNTLLSLRHFVCVLSESGHHVYNRVTAWWNRLNVVLRWALLSQPSWVIFVVSSCGMEYLWSTLHLQSAVQTLTNSSAEVWWVMVCADWNSSDINNSHNKQVRSDFKIYRETLHTELWKDDIAVLSLVLRKLYFKSNTQYNCT